ncbi:phage holin family protein [Romboutsia sp. 1001285H_161024_C4]|uniref:phage holin family protein n=1 Tax=Romboutsia sp. 1001285H_161024_C4 TaxID=2787109 RepID=UPI0018991649|nr:phage holin family protein [Romboutsia sp. 1001285H_161024_C4]
MNLYDERLSAIIALSGTTFTWLFGGWDIALQVLISFMAMDYITGLLRGFITNKWSSDKGFKGIARKSVILIILMLSVMLDRLINNGQWIFRTLICYFYIANEGLSILENVVAIGLPIPPRIKEALEQLKEGNKKSRI